MENIGDDEKKPFDAEAGGMDDDQFPDPEEVLHIGQPGRNWIVKIPKYMMERWSQIKEASQPLGKIRHYADPTQRTHGRFFLVVPRDPPVVAPPGVTLPEEETCDCFELDFVSHDVPNQYVVAQRPKPNVDPRTRARDTALHGKVVYEMNARPFFNDNYQARVRARNEAANTPARQIRMLEESVAGGQGMINRMASGVANDRGFSDLIRQKPKAAKGQFERMARIPRNQLLDLLFSLFREQPRWPIRVLRERTQQPEVYLKEVLSEIATLHRSGEHAGTWELKPNFVEDGIKGEGSSMAALYQMAPKAEHGEEEEEDEDDDDDDDEDDMEEVA